MYIKIYNLNLKINFTKYSYLVIYQNNYLALLLKFKYAI